MTFDTVIGLAAMALAAFCLRGSGILLGGLLPSTGKTGQFLREMPGAVMISLCAPAVVLGGPAEWLATVLTAIVAWKSRNLMVTLVAGLVLVWGLRHVM